MLFYNIYIFTFNYMANFFYKLFNYNNSLSTYLLRKQAAAVEGGNRREEAETKKDHKF